MFAKIFEFITKLSKKYNIQNNPIVINLIPYYHKIQRFTTSYVLINPNDKSILSLAQQSDFFAKNAERVDTVANMLADDKSKKTYLGMVKFRQTCKKKDFPTLYYEKTEYFIEELKFCNDEVFIDCGAYIGDTIDEFLKRCPAYKQIAAFEPEPKNFEKLKENYGNNPKIILINAGVYDKEGIVNFEGVGLSGMIIAGGSRSSEYTSQNYRQFEFGKSYIYKNGY